MAYVAATLLSPGRRKGLSQLKLNGLLLTLSLIGVESLSCFDR
jgi:hypothetical protein